MRFAAAVLCAVLCACSSSAPRRSAPETKAQPAPENPPIKDQAIKFPQQNLVKMELVPAHLLGKSFMPGGNLATYKSGKLQYQQFLGQMSDSQQAAFLLLDWQKALTPAQYLAHMGGYYGNDAGRPVYVFVKGAWVAGIVGLPEAKADLLARQFAMRF